MRRFRSLAAVFTLMLLATLVATSAAQIQRPLVINRAVYGKEGKGNDVTTRVRSLVRNGTLDIRVDNDTMGGDPNEHIKKTLKLDYTYRGVRQHIVVNEKDRLRIP